MGGFLTKRLLLCVVLFFTAAQRGRYCYSCPEKERLLATQERSNDILSTSMAGLMRGGEGSDLRDTEQQSLQDSVWVRGLRKRGVDCDSEASGLGT